MRRTSQIRPNSHLERAEVEAVHYKAKAGDVIMGRFSTNSEESTEPPKKSSKARKLERSKARNRKIRFCKTYPKKLAHCGREISIEKMGTSRHAYVCLNKMEPGTNSNRAMQDALGTCIFPSNGGFSQVMIGIFQQRRSKFTFVCTGLVFLVK